MKHPNRFNPNSGPVLTIHDFNTGIIYNISSNKSGTVCKASFETHNDRWFAADSGHHHIRMRTTQELFNIPQRNGSSPLVYKGTASVRGIDADIWVGKFIAMNRKTNKSREVEVVEISLFNNYFPGLEKSLNSSFPSDKQLSNFACLGQVFVYCFYLVCR